MSHSTVAVIQFHRVRGFPFRFVDPDFPRWDDDPKGTPGSRRRPRRQMPSFRSGSLSSPTTVSLLCLRIRDWRSESHHSLRRNGRP